MKLLLDENLSPLWIRRGNCSTDVIRALLTAHRESIDRLGSDPDSACLVLY